MDKKAADMVAPIVGAKAEEVCMMQTLTANIHLLMCAFYKPDIKGRHKVIIESKAFPSDHVSLIPTHQGSGNANNKISTQSTPKSACTASTQPNQ